MITVRLYCHNGASTKLLVTKMTAQARELEDNFDIEALPYSSMAESAQAADVILLAPQVRFKYDAVAKEYPGKIVLVLDTTEYGMLAADKILSRILTEIQGRSV